MPAHQASRSRLGHVVVASVVIAATAVAARAPAVAAPAPSRPAGQLAGGPASSAHGVHWTASCPAGAAGAVRCFALLQTDTSGRVVSTPPAPRTSSGPAAAGTPSGAIVPMNGPYGPADLQSAYKLPSKLLGSRQTIAIVDAFDDPNAGSDLSAYRARYGLPPCTSASGCFTKVNQDGQASPLPPPDPGWAFEESLDLDMASAICPNCHILLVEATDNTGTNLFPAENEAASFKPAAISNSWGSPEFPGEASFEHFFHHPGIAVTVASGDFGYGPQFPAASQYVTAVGGTTLAHAANGRGWHESAWIGAGSGCSAYIPKPAWQTGSTCPHRALADVAAVAAPESPVSVYDTYQAPGWTAAGGTSVAAPVIAGIYALAGHPSQGASSLYTHASQLFDITEGSNIDPTAWTMNGGLGGAGFQTAGTASGCADLCTARPGWDGPTGNGTPDGLAAFGGPASGVPPSAGDGSGGPGTGWSQVAVPQNANATLLDTNGTFPGEGVAVDALSPSDVWFATTAFPASLITSVGAEIETIHWNGKSMRVVPTVQAGSFVDLLNDHGENPLSFSSGTDGWLGGVYTPWDIINYTNAHPARYVFPLLEHWNGTRWSVQALGDETAGSFEGIQSLAALSPTDVWALPEGTDSRLLHWDGTAWASVSAPAMKGMGFQAISALSPHDIWISGAVALSGNRTAPAALHWDGTKWTRLTGVMPPKVSWGNPIITTFVSISARADRDVWANVLQFVELPDGRTAQRTNFIEHWDGKSWSISKNPIQGLQDVHLTGIKAVAPDDVWSTGWTGGIVQPIPESIMLHWNGRSWRETGHPNPPTLGFGDAGGNDLISLSADAPNDVWAIGAITVSNPYWPLDFPYLVEHFTGKGG
jgi:Subtilase family